MKVGEEIVATAEKVTTSAMTMVKKDMVGCVVKRLAAWVVEAAKMVVARLESKVAAVEGAMVAIADSATAVVEVAMVAAGVVL